MTLKVLSVGAGFFANLQIEAWSREERVAVVGVVDRNRDAALAASDAHLDGRASSYESLEQALEVVGPYSFTW